MVFMDFHGCAKAAAQLGPTYEVAMILHVTYRGGDHIVSLVVVTGSVTKPHCHDNNRKHEIQECGALR